MTHKITVLEWVAIVLVIIGSLNWGLVGFFGFNLVAAIFGEMTALARIVYALVGLAALLFLFMTIPKFTKGCELIAGRQMKEVPR
jgi:hypothetical protein